MDLGDRGYVYTLITLGASLIIFSLVLFYFNIEEYPMEQAITRLSVDKLHYLVESIRKDCQRSVMITSQRAATYAVNYAIEGNKSLEDYEMQNCTDFVYYTNGPEAAIAELMYCGTFNGDSKGPAQYMENHTLRDWVDKMRNYSASMNYMATIKFKNLTIAPYDSWNFVVTSRWDITVSDKLNSTHYKGRDLPVLTVIPLNTLEDPSYHINGGIPSVLRYIKKCPDFEEYNGSTLDTIIDEGCYIESDNDKEAPSFFDRLQARKTLSRKYVEQAWNAAAELNYPPKSIGLESLLNLDLLERYGAYVRHNDTQVDYLYWLNTSAYCGVRKMSHSRFRIDTEHAVSYGVKGLECAVIVSNSTGVDEFLPASMTVPLETIIVWSNPDPTPHQLRIQPDVWGEDIDLASGSTFSWEFTEPAAYDINCLTTGHTGAVNRIIVPGN